MKEQGPNIPNMWSRMEGGNYREFPSNRDKEIWSYVERLTYRAGEPISLYVHTTSASFNLEVIHDTLKPRTVLRLEAVPGIRQNTPPDAAVTGCGWTAPVVLVPDSSWGTGAFVLRSSVDGDAQGENYNDAFVVIRPEAGQEKPMALILTTGTWAAYNDWGGANHYRSWKNDGWTDDAGRVLSRSRPWSRGLIAQPDDAMRHSDEPDLAPNALARYPTYEWAVKHGYSLHYASAGWGHYERRFALWAENLGYEFDVLTQDDLHHEPGCLDPYRVGVLVGHDEYWSWEMRDTMDSWLDAGGRLARFAGNMLTQIRLENDGKTQCCYKNPAKDPMLHKDPRRVTTYWDSALVARPTAASFGVAGIRGGYTRYGYVCPRGSGGYTVYRPEHWSLADTDLYYGDVFGAGASRILAYEVDGLSYTFRDGLPYPTDRDRAPDSVTIIAMAPAAIYETNRHGVVLASPWEEILAMLTAAPHMSGDPPESFLRGNATMVSFTRGAGEVFNAGCCQWVSGLIRRDPAVEQITRNVLNRFLGSSGRASAIPGGAP
jgi:hypothetical protein